MAIETERLLLREYTIEDYDSLYEIMSDAETMQHYPAPFDEARTRRWIEWNLENYAQYGFGLWAVVLKETGEFIGEPLRPYHNTDVEVIGQVKHIPPEEETSEILTVPLSSTSVLNPSCAWDGDGIAIEIAARVMAASALKLLLDDDFLLIVMII